MALLVSFSSSLLLRRKLVVEGSNRDEVNAIRDASVLLLLVSSSKLLFEQQFSM